MTRYFLVFAMTVDENEEGPNVALVDIEPPNEGDTAATLLNDPSREASGGDLRVRQQRERRAQLRARSRFPGRGLGRVRVRRSARDVLQPDPERPARLSGGRATEALRRGVSPRPPAQAARPRARRLGGGRRGGSNEHQELPVLWVVGCHHARSQRLARVLVGGPRQSIEAHRAPVQERRVRPVLLDVKTVYQLVGKGRRAAFAEVAEYRSACVYVQRERADAELPAFQAQLTSPDGPLALFHIDAETILVRVVELEVVEE